MQMVYYVMTWKRMLFMNLYTVVKEEKDNPKYSK